MLIYDAIFHLDARFHESSTDGEAVSALMSHYHLQSQRIAALERELAAASELNEKLVTQYTSTVKQFSALRQRASGPLVEGM